MKSSAVEGYVEWLGGYHHIQGIKAIEDFSENSVHLETFFVFSLLSRLLPDCSRITLNTWFDLKVTCIFTYSHVQCLCDPVQNNFCKSFFSKYT